MAPMTLRTTTILLYIRTFKLAHNVALFLFYFKRKISVVAVVKAYSHVSVHYFWLVATGSYCSTIAITLHQMLVISRR